MTKGRKANLRGRGPGRVIGITAAFAALAFAGCQKPVADAPPVPGAPAPPSPAVAEATTPPESHRAPPGIYFLVAKVSVETDSGITGLPPGTPVRQVGPTDFIAPDGQKITLRPDQITDDLRVAHHVAGLDATAQNVLRQSLTPPRARARRTAADATPPPVVRTAPAPTAPPPRSDGAAIGSSGVLGGSHSRVKDGWVWEKMRDGTWVKMRKVR